MRAIPDIMAQNSLYQQRRMAGRLVAAQAIIVVLAAMVSLPWGWQHAVATLAGGILVMAGTIVMAFRGLTRGQSVVIVVRMLTGLLLRWVIILAGLYLILVVYELPPISVVAGLIIALLAPLVKIWS